MASEPLVGDFQEEILYKFSFPGFHSLFIVSCAEWFVLMIIDTLHCLDYRFILHANIIQFHVFIKL